jgi:hypothetical protein
MMITNANAGLPAMMSASTYFDDEFGLDIEFFGREAFDVRDSCKLVMAGRWLLFELQIDGGWLFLRAQNMDAGDMLKLLATLPDGPKGWQVVRQLIGYLEEQEIKDVSHLSENAWRAIT